MKRLICEREIRQLAQAGEKICLIDADTLITPSARDAARAAGITFAEGSACCQPPACQPVAVHGAAPDKISADLIYKVVKGLADQGKLDQSFFERFPALKACCGDSTNGCAVVRGAAVSPRPVQQNRKITVQQFAAGKNGGIATGILAIDRTVFQEMAQQAVSFYVLEGSLSIPTGGTVQHLHAGDTVSFPQGAEIVLDAQRTYCRLHYSSLV